MMAGYSGTPLAKKLGIREGYVVVLAGAPDGFEAMLDPLPAGAVVGRRARSGADVVLLFAPSRAVLERRFAPLAAALDRAGGLWVCWPKRSSGVVTDLDENAVRSHGLAAGLVDNKVCAVDDTWSGLRFVYRRADR
jgi:hypothetical protein